VSAEPHIEPQDESPGNVVQFPGCPNCRNLADNYERELARLGQHLHEAELSMRGLRSAKTKLQNEIDGKADEHRRLPEAKEVYEYWRAEIAPLAKEFNGKRRKAVLARLDGGRSVDELKQAVDGAKIDATTGPNGVRHDDLEFICREDQHVLRFINAATAAATPGSRAPRRRRSCTWCRGVTSGQRTGSSSSAG
jgi:hypothetical protein